MAGRRFSIEEVTTLLAETPQRIATLYAGLSPVQLQARPGPDEWSVNDVLAHLRACADVWGGTIARILAEDRPALRAVSPRTWIKKTDYPDLAFEPSFRAFAAQRADLMAVLEPLSPEGWPRTATVIGLMGGPQERTVLDYADRLAGHERQHVRQMESVASAMRGS